MDYLKFLSKRLLALLIASAFLLNACKDDDVANPASENLVQNESAEVAIDWMDLYLELDRYAQDYRPGPAPRALAYINLAAYEASMQGMPEFQSLHTLYQGLAFPEVNKDLEYHWPTVVNSVYASLMQRFFPGNILSPEQRSDLQFKILTLEQKFNDGATVKVGSKIVERSREHGLAIADIVWAWAGTDNYGNEAFLDPRPANYTPAAGPGLWKPTPPDFSGALYPYWGNVRAFAIKASDKLAKAPIPFSESPNSLLYVQALETKNLVSGLTFEDQWIAEFWSDDFVGTTFSPPARWISVTSQILKDKNYNLETAIYAYAKVSIALNDAAVACWYSKYTYNVERPVTYIQRVLDPAWLPHWDSTPSFPAYPSGHSTFGAAAAEVLSHVFGYAYQMTDRSHEGRLDFYGMPRSFASFYEMAAENAYSRLPLGVHFRMDAEEGLRLGYQVGRRVNEMPFKR